MTEPLLIEMGIGWKRDPEKPNGLVSADIRDYVAEIERLRKELAATTYSLSSNKLGGE